MHHTEQILAFHNAGLISTRVMLQEFKKEGILPASTCVATQLTYSLEGMLKSYLRRKAKQISLIVDRILFE